MVSGGWFHPPLTSFEVQLDEKDTEICTAEAGCRWKRIQEEYYYDLRSSVTSGCADRHADHCEVEEETVELPTEPQMLPEMAELYAQNPDTVGWIKIEGTVIDYPVMHTPDDPEKYLRKNFQLKYETMGLPFIKYACDTGLGTESDNLIIYGHNMRNGTSFAAIMDYDEEEFWKEHPVIQYKTLYEERTYEVIAAFYDQVYKKTDKVFKYYNFIDPESEEEFNEGIAYFLKKSKIDTGLTAEYGDKLISLVTCSKHKEKGRFVVVARMVEDDEPSATVTE